MSLLETLARKAETWGRRTLHRLHPEWRQEALNLEGLRRYVIADAGRGEPLAGAYTGYCGADLMVFFDGQVQGLTQAIEWYPNSEKDETGKQVYMGYLRIAEIGCIKDKSMKDPWEGFPGVYAQLYNDSPEPVEITVRYANEYGLSCQRKLKGVRFNKEHGGMSIDDIIGERSYTFTAESLSPFEPKEDSEAEKAALAKLAKKEEPELNHTSEPAPGSCCQRANEMIGDQIVPTS